jgi:SAM-dependent methyltransferase
VKAGQGGAPSDKTNPIPGGFPRLLASQYAQFDEDLPLWKALAQRQGGPILELGCGPGRVLAALLPQGHAVIGLDHSHEMLLLARAELGAQFTQPVSLVQADLRRFRLGARFSLIFIACNTFAELDDSDADAALKCIRAHLSEYGVLALDLPPASEWRWAESGEPLMAYVETRSDNPVQVYARGSFDREGGRYRVRWLYDELFPDGGVVRHEIDTVYHLRGPERVRELVAAAGFPTSHAYGSYHLEAYQPNSERLIVLASPSASTTLPRPR